MPPVNEPATVKTIRLGRDYFGMRFSTLARLAIGRF